jgi:TolA-binding protein
MKNAAEIKKLNEEIERLEGRVAVLTAKGAHPKLIEAREDELAELYIKLDVLENGDTPAAEAEPVAPIPTPTPIKKGQGRPKGSKNRPKAGVGAAAKVGVLVDKPAKPAKPVAKLAGTYNFQATGKIAKSGKSAEFAPTKGSPFAGQGALYVTLSSLPEGCESFEITITA